MKKTMLLTLATVTAAGLVTAGLVKAQTSTADQSATTTETAVTTDTGSTATPCGGERHQRGLANMAETLGMTTDELQSALDSGKEFYQIAADQGLTYTELQAQRQAEYESKLKDMVSSGFLTQEQADQFLANFQERAADGGSMMGGGHGRGMGFGF